MESDIGRKRAIEFEVFSKPAEFLKDKVSADSITVLGAVVGVVGSYFLSDPEGAIERIEQVSDNKLHPSKKQIKIAGAIALGASYVCDLLDGAVARKSEKGETFHGTVIDGMANKLVDTTPALIFASKANNFDQKATWLSYIFTSPMATMIRSRGVANDIPVPKTGFGGRASRVPVLLAGLFGENFRSISGKVLTLQSTVSAISRYKQIKDSGNKEAVDAVNKDLIEYSALFILSQVISQEQLPDELVALGLDLVKLGHVKLSEAKNNTKK